MSNQILQDYRNMKDQDKMEKYIESLLEGIKGRYKVVVKDNKPTIIRVIDYNFCPFYEKKMSWYFSKRMQIVCEMMEIYGFNREDFSYQEEGINKSRYE